MLSDPSSATVASPSKGRSRVANGSTLWIDGVDGRSAEARRFRDVLAALVREAFHDDPTEAQRQLSRRAAALIVWTEMLEARLAAGEWTAGFNPRPVDEHELGRLYEAAL